MSKKIRKAKISDTPSVLRLINYYAKRELMLPRSQIEIYENIRNFLVYEDRNKVIGVCALTIWKNDLAEIRSLAVLPKDKNKGIGKKLVKESLCEAKNLGIKKVFVLTYVPEFFEKLGFKRYDKMKFPQKIWKVCINCPKFTNCKEKALIYRF